MYVNTRLELPTESTLMMTLGRNWLARPTVNREVDSSILSGDDLFLRFSRACVQQANCAVAFFIPQHRQNLIQRVLQGTGAGNVACRGKRAKCLASGFFSIIFFNCSAKGIVLPRISHGVLSTCNSHF